MNKRIKEAIIRQEAYIKLYEVIIPILTKYADKTINKRLATELAKAMPTFTVHYNPNYCGGREVSIWGNGLGYDNKLTLHFYEPSPIMVCKTEAKVIAEELKSCRARLESCREEAEQLKKEANNFAFILADYQKITGEYSEALAAFRKKWGRDGGIYGIALSYTTREALKEANPDLPYNL